MTTRDGPDIARGWDQLAEAYQREVGWPDHELTWGFRCPPEEELRLVSDVVRGADVLVVGCGGGQDLIALHRMGAGSLVGIDPSQAQLDHARARLDDAAIVARLEVGEAADLAGIVERSIDLVVSVHALNYVADLPAAVREMRRVLRPDGVFAFSVMHPADAATDDRAPHGWHRPWFEVEHDWEWDGLAEETVELRSWFRSPSDWFTALHDGGMLVERLLEPAPVDDPAWIDRGWLDDDSYAKLDVVPGTILVRAREPSAG